MSTNYKRAVGSVTGLQAGFTDSWKVLDGSAWRSLTAAEKSLVDAKSDELDVEDKVIQFTKYVDEVIAKEIIDYNYINKTAFSDENSVEKYNRTGAFHYDFASSLIDWIVSADTNIGVWAKARSIQANVIAGVFPEPTEEEFKAMLPTRY